jgi:glycosyltransferase involved in cell wall biosynthesis
MAFEDAAVLIPAWNEEATIGRVVTAAMEYGRVIVVDDGSSDRTVRCAEKCGAHVVRHEVNLGYDHALLSGLRACSDLGAALVVTMDADGQHDPLVLKDAFGSLRAGAELVLGCRPRLGRWSEHVVNAYARVRFGVPDLLCGLKGYRMDLVHEAGPESVLSSIGTGVALWGLRRGRRVGLLAVPVRPRQGSARFGAGLTANMRILRILVKEMTLSVSGADT